MRINCVPVETLTDEHLRAEWVEMLMLPPYLERSINSKNGLALLDDKKYRLNTGHARFFYDKLEYVNKRYLEIELEMKARGFRTNPVLDLSSFPRELFNDWKPTDEDMYNNLHRILTRINTKPRWYSYYRKKVKDWVKFYQILFKDYKYEFRESDRKR